MMWNWLVSALASGATLVLYDGSPFHPDGNALFDYADKEGVTLFGTSANYIDALAKDGYRPIDTHDLDTARTLTSTGAPLMPAAFAAAYAAVKKDLHLAAITGGKALDICLSLGTPLGRDWWG